MNVSVSKAPGLIANLTPFRAGNLRGDAVAVLSAPPSVAGLPPEVGERLREAQMERSRRYLAGEGREAVQDAPQYIVTSYGIPVAWVTVAGEVILPDAELSGTMRRHQDMARAALTRQVPALR